MKHNTCLIILALFLALLAFSCDDDNDSNDPCKRKCEKIIECDPDNASPYDECKSDCDQSAEGGSNTDPNQACMDAAIALNDCYLNSNCDDFIALTNLEPTDACKEETEAANEACIE